MTVLRIADQVRAAVESSRDEVRLNAEFCARMAAQLAGTPKGARYQQMAEQAQAQGAELELELAAAAAIVAEESAKELPKPEPTAPELEPTVVVDVERAELIARHGADESQWPKKPAQEGTKP